MINLARMVLRSQGSGAHPNPLPASAPGVVGLARGVGRLALLDDPLGGAKRSPGRSSAAPTPTWR